MVNPTKSNTIHPQKDFGIQCFPTYQKAKYSEIYPRFDQYIWKWDVFMSFLQYSSSHKANSHKYGKSNHEKIHDILVIIVIVAVSHFNFIYKKNSSFEVFVFLFFCFFVFILVRVILRHQNVTMSVIHPNRPC